MEISESNHHRGGSTSEVCLTIGVEHVLATIIPVLHFAPPSAVDVNGVRKEIYWRMDGPQVPVVRPPHGDFKTTQVPLDVRLARETDFPSSQ